MKKVNNKKPNSSSEQNDYIKSLELTINLLQNELKNATERIADIENKQHAVSIDNNQNIVDLNFSNRTTVPDILDTLHTWLIQYFNVIELDIFMLDENRQLYELKDLALSTTLKSAYNDLEERGLIEWVMDAKEVRILQSFSNDNNAIKSLIVYPVNLPNNSSVVLLANSTLTKEDLLRKNISKLTDSIEKTIYVIKYLEQNSSIKNIKLEQSILHNQISRSSSKITASEIVLIINNEISLPLKVIKSNLDLIEKGIGNTSHRMSIVAEQFKILNNTQNLMKKIGNKIETYPGIYSFIDILNIAIEAVTAKLRRNGISIIKSINIESVEIKCFETQIIFAILNIFLHSIESMPDGGKINLSLHNNEENNSITLLINNTGLGLDAPDIEGNLISLSDFSDSKIEARYLFMLSQHILLQHHGKFSVFSEPGKGTTYKITLPVAKKL